MMQRKTSNRLNSVWTLSPSSSVQESLLEFLCLFYLVCSTCNEWALFENKNHFCQLAQCHLALRPFGKLLENRGKEISKSFKADKRKERTYIANQVSGRVRREAMEAAQRCRRKFYNCPINIPDLISLHYISSNSLEGPA